MFTFDVIGYTLLQVFSKRYTNNNMHVRGKQNNILWTEDDKGEIKTNSLHRDHSQRIEKTGRTEMGRPRCKEKYCWYT